MVIDTNNINSSSGANGARRSSAPIVTSTSKAQPSETEVVESGSKDSVILSPEAQNLARLQTKISSLPDVNLDRVASIKLAIAQGRFEINPERIAENMLNQDELLG